jgi:hypothetical protein
VDRKFIAANGVIRRQPRSHATADRLVLRGEPVRGEIRQEARRSAESSSPAPARMPSPHDAERDRAGEARLLGLTGEELEYLAAIARTPLMAATERDRNLGLSAYSGHRRRTMLVDTGHVHLSRLRTGRRGSTVVLVELTEKAARLLDELGIRPARVRGRGSLARRYYQRWLADWAARHGWFAEIESSDTGADVMVHRRTDRLGIALILGTDGDELADRNLDPDAYDELYVVSPDADVLRCTQARVRCHAAVAGRAHVKYLCLARLVGDVVTEEQFVLTGPRRSGSAVERNEAEGHGRARPARVNAAHRNRRRGAEAAQKRSEALHRQIAEALRHRDDALALDHLPLARLPLLETYTCRYAGRTAAGGLALQHLLREATRRLTAFHPDGKFERFARAYIAGATVACAGRRAGVTREHASRVFRPRLVERLAAELPTLLDTTAAGSQSLSEGDRDRHVAGPNIDGGPRNE